MGGERHLDRFKGRSLKTAFSRLEQQPNKKNEHSRITLIDKQIKARFWDLIEMSYLQSRKIDISEIYANICTYTHFYSNILNNPYKFKWLLQQEAAWNDQSTLIEFLMQREMLKLLELPLLTEKGKLIAKNADRFLRAYEALDKKLKN